jgi:hypothetical protein
VFHPSALVKQFIDVVRDVARGRNARLVRFQILVDRYAVLNGKSPLSLSPEFFEFAP